MSDEFDSGPLNSPAGLVDHGQVGKESDDFVQRVLEELRETEEAVIDYASDADLAPEVSNWANANEVISNFRPVPQFIWNISNFVFSKNEPVEKLPDGLVFGLRRLLFAVASDPVLGAGEKINQVHKALRASTPDVIAATAVLHAMCRRLMKFGNQRVWRPIIDDALLRARLGFVVGSANENFGPGRGMLAGFAGRSGLAILLAVGEIEQAQEALQELAKGSEIRDVGLKVYGCDPLQVSAMALSAAGCGRDAALGTVSYAGAGEDMELSRESQSDLWYSAFTVIERVRMSQHKTVHPECWRVLFLENTQDQDILIEESRQSMRRGHGWAWIASV